MVRLVYPRDEWVAIARELAATYRDTAPPGLVARIDALLAAAPAGWTGEPYALELDETSADVVRAIVRLGCGPTEQTELAAQQRASVAEADAIVRHHPRES